MIPLASGAMSVLSDELLGFLKQTESRAQIIVDFVAVRLE